MPSFFLFSIVSCLHFVCKVCQGTSPRSFEGVQLHVFLSFFLFPSPLSLSGSFPLSLSGFLPSPSFSYCLSFMLMKSGSKICWSLKAAMPLLKMNDAHFLRSLETFTVTLAYFNHPFFLWSFDSDLTDFQHFQIIKAHNGSHQGTGQEGSRRLRSSS